MSSTYLLTKSVGPIAHRQLRARQLQCSLFTMLSSAAMLSTHSSAISKERAEWSFVTV